MKIITTFAILFFLFFCQFSFGQDVVTDIYGKRMKSIAALENKLGSKLFQADGDIAI